MSSPFSFKKMETARSGYSYKVTVSKGQAQRTSDYKLSPAPLPTATTSSCFQHAAACPRAWTPKPSTPVLDSGTGCSTELTGEAMRQRLLHKSQEQAADTPSMEGKKGRGASGPWSKPRDGQGDVDAPGHAPYREETWGGQLAGRLHSSCVPS